MNPTNDPRITREAEADAVYSLEVLAELTGVSSHAILSYREEGLIRSSGQPPEEEAGSFDAEAIHTLRRIEYLRRTCAVNEAGLKLILGLMDEVERLRSRLRDRR